MTEKMPEKNHEDSIEKETVYCKKLIETNVTVERLAIFKKKYYDLAYAFSDRLAQMLGTTQDAAYKMRLACKL